MIVGTADQASESLCEAGPDDAVIIGRASICGFARCVEDRWLGPGHTFHDDLTERVSWHIDSVSQGIGAKQARTWIVPEDVDQCSGVDRIDMLGLEREPVPREAISNACMDGAQPPDRCKQAKCSSTCRRDQPCIGTGKLRNIAALDVRDNQDG